jgi:hypothetical protein
METRNDSATLATESQCESYLDPNSNDSTILRDVLERVEQLETCVQTHLKRFESVDQRFANLGENLNDLFKILKGIENQSQGRDPASPTNRKPQLGTAEQFNFERNDAVVPSSDPFDRQELDDSLDEANWVSAKHAAKTTDDDRHDNLEPQPIPASQLEDLTIRAHSSLRVASTTDPDDDSNISNCGIKSESELNQLLARLESARQTGSADEPISKKGMPSQRHCDARPSESVDSVAQILSRLNAEGAFSNYDPPAKSPESNNSIGGVTGQSNLPETLPTDPQSRESTSGDRNYSTDHKVHERQHVAISDVDDDDSVSVQSYMSSLLQRLRGQQPTETVPPPPPIEQPQVSQTPTEPPQEPQHKQLPGFLAPEDYIPKRTAPERNSNMAAMRDLANQSTATALLDSAQRRRQARAMAEIFLTAGGITGAIMLRPLIDHVGDLASLTAIALLIGSLICAIDYSRSNIFQSRQTKPGLDCAAQEKKSLWSRCRDYWKSATSRSR